MGAQKGRVALPPLGPQIPPTRFHMTSGRVQRLANSRKCPTGCAQDEQRREAVHRHVARVRNQLRIAMLQLHKGTDTNKWGGTAKWGAAACSPPDGLADLNSLNIVLFPKISKIRIWLTLEQEECLKTFLWNFFWMKRVSNLTGFQYPIVSEQDEMGFFQGVPYS